MSYRPYRFRFIYKLWGSYVSQQAERALRIIGREEGIFRPASDRFVYSQLILVQPDNSQYLTRGLTPEEENMLNLNGFRKSATDDKQLSNAVETALEIGYRHFDTSVCYDNERIIGRVLSKWLKSGKVKREDLCITSQLPMTHVHPDLVEPCLKESLENLQLDYVDVFLVQFPVYMKEVGADKPMELLPTDHIGVWKKVEEQVDAKRARAIGIADFNASQIVKIINNARIKPANIQIELHIYHQQKEFVEFCYKNNITIVSYSTLGSPGTNDFGRDESSTPNLLRDSTVIKIAGKHNKTAGQVLLRFWTQRNIAVIPKSVKPDRLRENFNISDFTLNSEDLMTLERLDKGRDGRVFRLEDWNLALKDHPEFPHNN